MTQIKLQNITKIYTGNDGAVVHDISLDIKAGQITALLGPSGSGKTTLLKMIAGLIAPTAGDILFDGESVLNILPENRNAVMVFQNYMLFPHMSVAKNVGFGLKMRGVDSKVIHEKTSAMLERVQLPNFGTRRVDELSGGQQQRVALARALVTEPRALLLDEPLSNLDAHLRDEMRELIMGIQRETGITTILVTHDQEEAVVLADKIALLDEGVLQQVGTSEDFYRRPQSERIARFFGGVNFFSAELKDNGVETDIGDFAIALQPASPDVHSITIRPEQVAVNVPADAPNSFTAEVISTMYMGAYRRYCFVKDGVRFDAYDSGSIGEDVAVGEKVRVQFPPEHLWLLE
ncbi:MAG: ABC transporter ATP-binding protein [Chloroflexota bacterium]